MSWNVDFEESAKRDLNKLDSSTCRQVIKKIEWLGEYFEEIQVQQLQAGWSGYFKLRAGDWRIAYTFNEKQKKITIWYIDNRDSIYKRRHE